MPTDFGRKARAYRLRHDMLLYDKFPRCLVSLRM